MLNFSKRYAGGHKGVDMLDVLQPAVWDELYYDRPDELAAYADSRDPALVVRGAHAHFHRTQDAAGTLRRLDGIDAAPAEGIRLLALCELGQSDPGYFERVLSRGYGGGYSPLELESSVYAEWAMSIACNALSRPDRALEHLTRAEHVAALLGMRGRLSILRLERERQRALGGRPDAEQIMRDVRACRSGRAKRFGLEVYVDALLGQGRYTDAWNAATRQRLGGGLQHLTAALAQQSPPEPTAEPLSVLGGAFDALRGAGEITLPELDGEPWRSYGLLATAASLTVQRSDRFIRAQLLGCSAPDQCAWRAGLAWVRWLRTGGTDGRPHALPYAARDLMSELHHADEVAAWLALLAPDEMTVLNLAGLAHPALSAALASSPILDHGYIRRGARAARINKAASEALLLDAVGGDTELWRGLHREERSRYRAKLSHYGLTETQLVNPAAVYRYAARYEQHAAQAGRVSDHLHAAQALRRAERMLPEIVQGSGYVSASAA